MSQRPISVKTVKMISEKGRVYFAKMEIYRDGKYIRNDSQGHAFKDGGTMKRHYNAGYIKCDGREVSNGKHFYY